MAATAVRHPPPLFPADPGLPDAAELLAGGGAQAVARFLSGRGLDPHQVTPAQAHYRPGRWLTVCFRAAAVESGTGRPMGLTVTVDRRAGEPDAVWAFPDDPALPGLAAAADPRLVARYLRMAPDDVAVETLRYRPRRRAVLRYRVRAGGRVVLAKVFSPALGPASAGPGRGAHRRARSRSVGPAARPSRRADGPRRARVAPPRRNLPAGPPPGRDFAPLARTPGGASRRPPPPLPACARRAGPPGGVR